MIQRKISMVGVFGTGKTSLVQRFVHSRFSEKYHSTVGVKIDRKQVNVQDKEVKLLLWDLEGRDKFRDVQASYLRGSAGFIVVVDGTRRETFEQAFDLYELATKAAGTVPCVLALNKADLADRWELTPDDHRRLDTGDWHLIQTSAKSGTGVEDAFHWLANATLNP